MFETFSHKMNILQEILQKLKIGRAKPLSINTYGGTEIPVFRRCVADMIERAVRIISIIENSYTHRFLYINEITNFALKVKPVHRLSGHIVERQNIDNMPVVYTETTRTKYNFTSNSDPLGLENRVLNF